MEYILITSVVFNIFILLKYIKTRIELDGTKNNMMELCLLMLEDEEISREDKIRVFEIYKRLGGK